MSTTEHPQQTRHTEAQPEIPRTIWVLASAAFIIALGYGFIAPVLPQFASSFNVSMAAAGAVVSVFALARLLGARARACWWTSWGPGPSTSRG